MFGPCLVMQYVVPVLSLRKLGLVVSALCFFLMVAWVGLQYVIVELPGHMHPLFGYICV